MSNEMKDPLDAAYESWLTEFLEKEWNQIPEDIRKANPEYKQLSDLFNQRFPKLSEDFKEAFRQGWLRCEDWYSENDDKEIIIGVTILPPPNPEDIN